MDPVTSVLVFAAALTVGAVTPGPSFIMVVRISVARSRRDGVAAALGMAVSGVIYAGLALLGLHAVLTNVAWLYDLLKLLGGLYLLYLAVGMWRGARSAVALDVGQGAAERSLGRSFVMGMLTQLSNPKTALVYGSLFAAVLPPEVPVWMMLGLPIVAFAIELVWYATVAIAFSASAPRAAYLRSKAWVDRVAGTLMGALGIRLMAEGVQRG